MKNRILTHALAATMVTSVVYVGCSSPLPPAGPAVGTAKEAFTKGCSPGTKLCFFDGEVSLCYDPSKEICCQDGSQRGAR